VPDLPPGIWHLAVVTGIAEVAAGNRPHLFRHRLRSAL
jgi:hypothetical protein